MEVAPGGALGRFLVCFWAALGVLLDLLEQRWEPIGGMWVIFGMLWGTRAGGSYALECFWRRLGRIL